MPLTCDERASGANLCEAATAAERELAHAQTEGGWIVAGEGRSKREYLLSTFGARVPAPPGDATDGVDVPLARTDVGFLCKPLAPAEAASVAARAVVASAGRCDVVEKAANAARAGAAMLLVAQWEDEPLERHASQPRSRADEVAIPVASITADAGAELRAASAAAVRVVPSARVRASTWRKLGELAEGVGWPRGREARDDLIAVWRRTAAGWPDREAALQRGIEIVDPGRASGSPEL